MNPIYKYFTKLTDSQTGKIDKLQELYSDWNQKINVISRKDMDNFYERHVLHSLAIAKFITFRPGSKIIDVGTGGGFPGIPLAIMFPEVSFTLIDSIGKKIKVVSAVAEALELKNVTALNGRSEQHKGQYDFVVSRAIAAMPTFVAQTRHLVSKQAKNAVGNGAICLKGGDLSAELKPFTKMLTVTALSQYYSEEFFKTKQLVHLAL